MPVSAVDRDSTSHPHFRTKPEAIGYGFLVPVFFMSSGRAAGPRGTPRGPLGAAARAGAAGALLLVRGLPAMLYLPTMGRRPALAAGLPQATSLPFIVAASQIGTEIRAMFPITGAALVSAGLLSVLLFPAGALSLLTRPQPAVTADEAGIVAGAGAGAGAGTAAGPGTVAGAGSGLPRQSRDGHQSPSSSP